MRNVVHAEVLKLTTVRTPAALAGLLVVLTAAAVAGVVGTAAVDEPGAGAARLAQAATTASALATLLGLLLVTNDFRHGTITQTLLVTPVRSRVVAAKVLTGFLAGLVFGLLAAAVAVAVGVPWSGARGYDLGWDADAVLAFVRLVAAYALWAALGVATGALVRNQVGAIVVTFAWFLVVEPLLTLIGLVISDESELGVIAPYLPGSAFDAFVGGGLAGAQSGLLSPPAGLALALAYVAVLAAAGAASLVRRDPR